MRTAEEIFDDINNENMSKEDEEDKSNVPVVVSFSEVPL